MQLIFKKIKQLITPQLFEKASGELGINEATLIKLSDPIIAGLFGALLTQGDNAETERIFKTFVSKVNDETEVEIYFLEKDADSKKIQGAIALGDAILFAKRAELISYLAELTDIQETKIEKLMTALIYSFGLDLGRKLTTGEYTITGLLGQIHAERNFFLGYIPSGMTSILGLPSLLAIGQNLSSDAKVVSDMVYYEIMHSNTPAKEKRTGWWKWFSLKTAL